MRIIFRFLVVVGMLGWNIAGGMAGPPPQAPTGQEYTVKRGDSLATIAEKQLGQQRFWPGIYEATNQWARSNSRFTPINDPNLIHQGQILWIPSATELAPVAATAATTQTGLLTVDINYIGNFYRETFNYSKDAPNIRHFAVVVPEAAYKKEPNQPGWVCSVVKFPAPGEPIQPRENKPEILIDLSVLHPVPYLAELAPGRYYVGACFIAAPLSREEAGVSDDVILYAGITGGGASSDYMLVDVKPGERRDIVFTLTDKNGWACPWVYTFNGYTFTRRSEILRNLKDQSLEAAERTDLGWVAVREGVVRLQIREEKAETTFLDALYLEVNGRIIKPEDSLLAEADGEYLVLRQGDVYEVRFDVLGIAAEQQPVKAALVSTGYYLPGF